VLLERTAANAPRDGRVLLLLGLTYEDLARFDDARRLYGQYAAAGGSDELRAQVAGRLAVIERVELRRAAADALAREATLSAGDPSPRSVAVFPFMYTGDDPRLAPLGRALAEMLATDLAQTSRITVLERARVQALLDEIGLAQGGLVEPSSGVRAGRLLSAGTVVQGRIGGGGDAVRLEALVVGAGQGDAAAADPIAQEAALRGLLDAEKALALGIYARMGVELTAAERERVGKRLTENVQALLVFGAALQASDGGDFRRAAELFRQAAEMDGTFDAARERAAAAEAAAATTAQVAAALFGPGPLPALEVGDVARLPLGRDPTSEALGSEGLSRPRATIEIILRRP
ncbi:MAG TPA: CsgG/HfaB family protein, partial [Longimicrobiaceae bacterium]|nr:CsgG/HfaB family protein [Longimicrobiaceae bacterium]